MSEKKDINKVDDYYSNLKTWNKSETTKKTLKIKKKIKIKPKKIIIKPKKEENKEKQDILKKDIVEREEIVREKVIKKENQRKVETPKIKEKEKTFNNKKFWNKFPKKSFKDSPKWETEERKKQKRSKLSPYKASKYRFNNFKEEKSFVRSSKIKKVKKEKKNIEDIKQNLVSHKGETITVPEMLNIKEFSEKLWVPLSKLIAEFMKNGLIVNINSSVDFDTAVLIADAFEIKLKKDNSTWVSVQDLLKWDLKELFKEEDLSKLEKKIPVVSIMWHVDHWKTSLLDYIRKEKIVDTEAWWITQSIWAYQVEHNNSLITFLDTPWHEAFTIMRARWAKSTDIAILVVAADEWVKPQTIESINHAKEAWIPVIVAINKMDKEWANPDHVKWQLAEHWLTPEDWWGDTPMVPVSAMTWFWIEELLEIIILVSDMQELKANPDRAWIATVIESHLDPNLWSVATVIINTWTIHKWDNVVCKNSYWKVKILKNYSAKSIKKAWPWTPVLIVWLDKVVEGWDIVQVVASPDVAKTKAIEYDEIIASQKKLKTSWLDILMSKIKTWNLKQLKIVLKADTNWSLEAVKNWLLKLSTEETNVSIIHSWVWNITESDVLMCEWSSAILIWFGVWVVPTAKKAIEKTKIEYINSKIIYHITERIEKIVTWMLDAKEIEIILTRAKVLKIFYSSKKFLVLGLSIPEWEYIEPKTKVKVIRNEKIIWKWEILSLKSWVEEVKKLEWPVECWIKFSWDIIPEEKDILEIYKIELKK